MPATGKVSLTRQTIYCFIPIMDLYAAYLVKKLRWYLLIMLGVGVGLSIITSPINPMPGEEEYNEKLLLENQKIDLSYAFLGENPQLELSQS